jgi:hypothetical protein
MYPEGITNHSPGLPRGTSGYPGAKVESVYNLEEVAERESTPIFRNPFRVDGVVGSHRPRVASPSASQPWALLRDALGVGSRFRCNQTDTDPQMERQGRQGRRGHQVELSPRGSRARPSSCNCMLSGSVSVSFLLHGRPVSSLSIPIPIPIPIATPTVPEPRTLVPWM